MPFQNQMNPVKQLVATKVANEKPLVYLNTRWGQVDILRQTPNNSGVLGGIRFSSQHKHAKQADLLITSEAEQIQQLMEVKKLNASLVYIFMENNEITFPDFSTCNSPDIIISPYKHEIDPSKTKVIKYPPCVPWFYGIEFATDQGLLHIPKRNNINLSTILTLKKPRKTKLISMICSGKAWTQGHRWRRTIADEAMQFFGDQIDIYGFGYKPLPDKRDGIDPYLYTIVIENGSYPNYITEKLVDALIGWSIPIYAGAENISEFLGQKIPTIEHGCSRKEALKKIKEIIAVGGICDQQLRQARDSVIHKLNLFEAIPKILGLSNGEI